MRGIFGGRLLGGLYVSMAVLLVLASVGTAQQQAEKKPLGGAFGSAFLGSAVGCSIVLVTLGAMAPSGEAVESWIFPSFVLFSVSVVCGSTLGIWLWDKENCSLGGTFLGAIVPPAIGAIIGAVTAPHDPAHPPWPVRRACLGAFLGSLASPLSATIGYAQSRRAQPSKTWSLFHIENRALRLGVPSPTFRPVLLPKGEVTWEYQIKLVSARF